MRASQGTNQRDERGAQGDCSFMVSTMCAHERRCCPEIMTTIHNLVLLGDVNIFPEWLCKFTSQQEETEIPVALDNCRHLGCQLCAVSVLWGLLIIPFISAKSDVMSY